ncbi:hypothetical protein C5Y96_10940 [Blastopirellula marina]|uniref:Uncharacterized protein n=1 Tax=Blastopirellula marina TaxID=124 RepID=A0A2S8FMY7_9BACT|nr:hypothetical protein C5Y96_10940 [Blastopirellula marina]RCS52449.1 hypothetical protein DTL36_10950 [Bremerella cremea]
MLSILSARATIGWACADCNRTKSTMNAMSDLQHTLSIMAGPLKQNSLDDKLFQLREVLTRCYPAQHKRAKEQQQ